MLRDQPQHCVCPNCRANILTQLKYDSGVAAWLIAGGLCLFGLGCGCCLIPFCLDGNFFLIKALKYMCCQRY